MNDKLFIPALTGIRALCVYFIFFMHLNPFSQHQHPLLYIAFNQFYSFLSWFFVLSGFVIYHKYYEIANLKNKITLHNYFIKRLARIFPVLIILTSITFLLGYRDGLYSAAAATKLYFLNITLLKGFSSTYILTGIGPSWSLSVEELFYVASPFIFLFTKNITALIKIILTCYAAGLLITLAFMQYPFEGFFSHMHFTMAYTFFGRIFEFACGIYLGMIVKQNLPARISPRTGLYAGLGIVLLTFSLLMFISWEYRIIHANEVWPGLFLSNIVLPVGIALIFYSLIYYRSQLQKFLASGIMVNLGKSTYSFYLLHTTFMLSFIYKYVSSNLLITFISMIVVSYIFYRIIEQPAYYFIKDRFSRKPPKSTGIKS